MYKGYIKSGRIRVCLSKNLQAKTSYARMIFLSPVYDGGSATFLDTCRYFGSAQLVSGPRALYIY